MLFNWQQKTRIKTFKQTDAHTHTQASTSAKCVATFSPSDELCVRHARCNLQKEKKKPNESVHRAMNIHIDFSVQCFVRASHLLRTALLPLLLLFLPLHRLVGCINLILSCSHRYWVSAKHPHTHTLTHRRTDTSPSMNMSPRCTHWYQEFDATASSSPLLVVFRDTSRTRSSSSSYVLPAIGTWNENEQNKKTEANHVYCNMHLNWSASALSSPIVIATTASRASDRHGWPCRAVAFIICIAFK